MFAIVHQMRTRIMTSPAFDAQRILGAILFENTTDRDIEGQPTADYLWNVKRVVPFLKVDKGLAPEKGGVQLMKPMPELSALLDKARAKRIFGTKMRSFIKQDDGAGIKDIVAQQFEIARQIIAADLVPIVEPEVDIHCPEKAKAEELLKAAVSKSSRTAGGSAGHAQAHLAGKGRSLRDFVRHPKVVRVVALSGGYTQKEGNERLRRNHGVVASFRGRWSRGCRPSNPMPSTTPGWTRPFSAFSKRPTRERQNGQTHRETRPVDSRCRLRPFGERNRTRRTISSAKESVMQLE